MVSGVSEGTSTGNSVLYFNVPDIQGAYEALRLRGVEFIHEPHIIHSTADYELWMAFFDDTQGNTMAIMDERVRASSGVQYTEGELVAVMYRGDVAVLVSAAVVRGGHAVVTRVGVTDDEHGRFSSRGASANYVLVPGARFLTNTADNGIAVLRLAGPTAFPAQL